jgi:formimidoylglutamate deiminase
MPSLFAPSIRLAEGWAENVRLEIDAAGIITTLTPNGDPSGAEKLRGWVVPGIPNLHSHAFQRALAGLGERRGGGDGDDFWSWREVMYRFLDRLTPEQVQIIATQLYVEMVEAGYSRVCEFHYLHRAPDGKPYDDSLQMAWAHVEAACEAGIALTLAPCLYSHGNFGGELHSRGQRRFILSTDAYLSAFSRLTSISPAQRDFDIAICFHSLRAVTPDQIETVLCATPEDLPIHIHVAEQVKEVGACVAWSGERPVEWLLNHLGLNDRWRLVHATHMTQTEAEEAAKSGAVAIVCPTTEGNLGDGFFPADTWFKANGALGIGTDSQITVDTREELRLFEYARRLQHRQRSLSVTAEQTHPGAHLWLSTARADARGGGANTGALAVGMRADFLVLDFDHINLAGCRGDALFDALVFISTPAPSPIRQNWIGGRCITQNGRHPKSEQTRAAYAKVLRELQQA